MKYKDKLNQLTPPDLYEKSMVMFRRSGILAIVNMFLCYGFLLTQDHSVSNIFLIAFAVMSTIIIVMIIRTRKVDKTFERKLKEEAEKRRKKIIEIEIGLHEIQEEEGGES